MLDKYTKDQINRVSLELLKSSKAFDIYPTPVDKIVYEGNLLIDKGVDLSKLNKSFFSKFTSSASKLKSVIRGLLDREEKVIYLDLTQLPTRQNFVKLHELGHDALYWQKDILDCVDNDETLNPDVVEQFEAEANYFASTTLFQQDRFSEKAKKFELTIPSILKIGQIFGASGHATLRKYVETSKNRCCLIVLEHNKIIINTQPLTVKSCFHSKSFITTYDVLELPNSLDNDWEFTIDYYRRRKMKLDGLITLSTKNGLVEFNYNYYNNGYNSFVLLFPVGEHKKSQYKVLLAKE